jgi:cytochrome c553
MWSLSRLSAVAIAVAFVVVSGGCADAGNAAQGEHVFAKCAPCHAKNNTAGTRRTILLVLGQACSESSGDRPDRWRGSATAAP